MARRADLKTGYDCNSNCMFCVIGDKLFTGDRTTAECLRELEQSRATCDDVVFTGAEVTIREDFFRLVGAAKQLGYRNIQIQTNGRMMAYARFCERSVAAGANEFSPSIHGHTAKIHDPLTRSRGSFDQIIAAIKNLKRLDQRIVTNTVIAKLNAPHLADLARMLVDLGVDQFQLAFPHPTGHAATYFDQVVPRMRDVRDQVHRALAIGRDAGVECMAEAMPFCQMQGYERHVAELHIPPTEIVYDGYVVPDYAADRMARGKVRFEQCATCRFEPICEGPWRQYPERVGSEEFTPVAGARVIDPALVLDPRFSLLGEEGPSWAQPPVGKAYTLLAVYPEAGSAGCTAQMRGLQAHRDRLDLAGVAVIAMSPDPRQRVEAFARELGIAFEMRGADDGETAARLRCGSAGGVVRTSYLVDRDGTIAHVFTSVDVRDHAGQVLRAIERLAAPPRPTQSGDELVVLRRRVVPEATA